MSRLSLSLLLVTVLPSLAAADTSVTIDSKTATVKTKTSTFAPVKIEDFSKTLFHRFEQAGFLRSPVLTDGAKRTDELVLNRKTTRTRHLFAEVDFLGRRLPVLVKVHEEVHSCYEDNPVCAEKATVRLTGPLASYESSSPYQSLESLFGGAQTVEWTLEKDPGGAHNPDPIFDALLGPSAGASSTLTAKFTVNGLRFERSVRRLVQTRYPREAQLVNDRLDTPFVLSGIARALKNLQQGIL